MRVLLPRIPSSITKNQLRHFVADVLNSKSRLPFTTKPSIDSCEVLVSKDRHGASEHHGLIAIHPESAARWFITHVKGKMLGNKRAMAREFLDRKINKGSPNPEDDRRNPHTKLETVEDTRIRVESLDQFRKQHN